VFPTESERDASNRLVRQTLAGNPFLTAAAGQTASDAIDIVVPIHDALSDLEECLGSLARETHSPFRLILVNDGSRDPEVSPFLAAISTGIPGVVVIDRASPLGFASSVNEGITLSRSQDVVLLNSDTIVTTNWLAKLVAVARRHAKTATVTPLTNNGTICSVPIPFEDNALPAGYDVQSFGALVEATSLRLFPETPTGVGFCMLIRRRALDDVGLLDADAFGPGYGEENDFCQRAARAGYVSLIADDTFVYHKGQASFGAAGDDLRARNVRRLALMHPGYLGEIDRVIRDHPLKAFHARLRHVIAGGWYQSTDAMRILHLLHHGGGTERHARDLAAMPVPSVRSYVLRSDGQSLSLDQHDQGKRVDSMTFPLMAPIGAGGPLFEEGYKHVLSSICWSLDVDVIHVHHLMHNTLDITAVAAARQTPYVVTLHDYYMMCPSYTLLASDEHPCSDCRLGNCGPSAAVCMHRIGKPASYLTEYQARMHDFLAGAARVFVPSLAAKEIITARFPDLDASIAIVEHGHVWGHVVGRPREDVLHRSEHRPNGLNVAVIGGLDVHKGLHVIRDVLRANRNQSITFHVYGTSSDEAIAAEPGAVRTLDGSRLVYHGRYDSNHIVEKLQEDRIDVGLHPAIWPETFSFTLSEFVAAGIPVIAACFGAQGERVKRFNLGWTVPDIRDAAAIVALLDHLIDHPEARQSVADTMNCEGALRSADAMWAEYLATYRALKTSAVAGGHSHYEAPSMKKYLPFLARELAATASALEKTREVVAYAEAELGWFRERMRSPRHRVAEAMALVLHKIPIVWPVIAAATDFVLRRRQRRGTTDSLQA